MQFCRWPIRGTGLVAAVGGVLFVSWGRLGAQSPTHAATDTVADTAHLATITTDTGAFAPGHRDFTRYNAPGLCLAAAHHTRAFLRRTLVAQASLDTLQLTPERDTLGNTGTMAVARACGAHFTLAAWAAWDLDNLFDLAVLEDNDSLAQAILTQRIAQTPTEEARLDLVRHAIDAYLDAEPLRMTVADTLMATIEAESASNPAVSIEMHHALLTRFADIQDTVALRREAERIIAVGRTATSVHSRQFDAMEAAYRALLTLAIFEYPDSIPNIKRRARQDLTRLMSPALKLEYLHNWGHKNNDMTAAQVLEKLFSTDIVPSWYSDLPSQLDRPVPRLQADYWFPVSDRDTLRPVRGKVNLICMGGAPSWIAYNSSGAEFAAHVRTWLAQYGAKGFVVTVVKIVEDSSQVAASGDHFQTAAEAARFWHWYYQDYEQLPVTVAVQVRHEQWLPSPDGRRSFFGDVTQFDQEMYLAMATKREEFAQEYHVLGITDILQGNDGSGQCVLIGRDGKMAAYTKDSYQMGTYFDLTIEWLLTRGTK